jgi:hypothetical protein
MKVFKLTRNDGFWDLCFNSRNLNEAADKVSTWCARHGYSFARDYRLEEIEIIDAKYLDCGNKIMNRG